MDASDIARVLFQDLRRLAEEQNGFQISDVIVAIPVGFSPRGRQELRHAAEAAGFRILSFVSEPTAAFFCQL